MNRNKRRAVCLAAAIMLTISGVGCTPLTKGFQDGLSDGLAAAISALIEAPITAAIDRVFGDGE